MKIVPMNLISQPFTFTACISLLIIIIKKLDIQIIQRIQNIHCVIRCKKRISFIRKKALKFLRLLYRDIHIIISLSHR